MTKLQERAVLTALHIGRWSATMSDGAVSDEVADRKNAAKQAGRYTKLLVSRNMLKDVNAVASQAKATYDLMTLPWANNAHILSTRLYTKYCDRMREHRHDFERAADQCAQLYPAYIGSAENKARLGELYDPADYPSVEEFRNKFYFDVEIMGVPDGSDFRAGLSDAQVQDVVKDTERRLKERLEGAMESVFERIHKVVKRMVEGLTDQEGSFRDSLVYNIKAVADTLPDLNINDDPRLTALHKQLTDQLVEHPPEILRVDEKVRAATAAKAEAILNKVSKYLGQ